MLGKISIFWNLLEISWSPLLDFGQALCQPLQSSWGQRSQNTGMRFLAGWGACRQEKQGVTCSAPAWKQSSTRSWNRNIIAPTAHLHLPRTQKSQEDPSRPSKAKLLWNTGLRIPPKSFCLSKSSKNGANPAGRAAQVGASQRILRI